MKVMFDGGGKLVLCRERVPAYELVRMALWTGNDTLHELRSSA